MPSTDHNLAYPSLLINLASEVVLRLISLYIICIYPGNASQRDFVAVVALVAVVAVVAVVTLF